MKIVIIGAGNVATHLGKVLKEAGNQIVQIYNRSEANAKLLAAKLDTIFITDISHIDTSADLFLYCIKDDVLCKLLESINISSGIHIHTAGSLSINIFDNNCCNFGVIYPLQTFSKNKVLNFSEIPVFIEANNAETESVLINLANQITTKVFVITSEQRAKLHLSAVFACNFTNFLYALASDIVTKSGLPFDVLKPLIAETADKINFLSPDDAQTGPAVRFDKKIVEKHISMLIQNPEIQNIYTILTNQIYNRNLFKK